MFRVLKYTSFAALPLALLLITSCTSSDQATVSTDVASTGIAIATHDPAGIVVAGVKDTVDAVKIECKSEPYLTQLAEQSKNKLAINIQSYAAAFCGDPNKVAGATTGDLQWIANVQAKTQSTIAAVSSTIQPAADPVVPAAAVSK